MNIRGYDVEVQPLADHLGGGFVAFAPALKGCLSDGATREQATAHLEDAINCWLAAAERKERGIPVEDEPDESMPPKNVAIGNSHWSLKLAFGKRVKQFADV